MRICEIDQCADTVFARSWCQKHYARWRRYGDPHLVLRSRFDGTPEQRFWHYAHKAPSGHWIWLGQLAEVRPWVFYGRISVFGVQELAHRYAFELLKGAIPNGLEIDHLCRVTRCVNPLHLQAVPHRTNTIRGESPSARHAVKTHCPADHPYSGDNLYITPTGNRKCRICKAAANRRWVDRGSPARR